MRMRKKKHLEERLEACAPVMLKMQNQNEHANDPLDDELFFDSMKVFGNNNPLHLEVGCGKGELHSGACAEKSRYKLRRGGKDP